MPEPAVGHLRSAEPGLPLSRGVMVGNAFYVAGHLGLDPASRSASSDPAVQAGLMLDPVSRNREE